MPDDIEDEMMDIEGKDFKLHHHEIRGVRL